MVTDGKDRVTIDIGAAEHLQANGGRGWLVRLHLRPGQTLALDDASLAESLRHLQPACDQDSVDAHFPFLGVGAKPACHAGAIAEFRLPPTAAAVSVSASLI